VADGCTRSIQRFFTPRQEIDACGYVAIALATALTDLGPWSDSAAAYRMFALAGAHHLRSGVPIGAGRSGSGTTCAAVADFLARHRVAPCTGGGTAAAYSMSRARPSVDQT
jgi:Phenazine biosynthesis-like protein